MEVAVIHVKHLSCVVGQLVQVPIAQFGCNGAFLSAAA
jgi:hypothetical protein